MTTTFALSLLVNAVLQLSPAIATEQLGVGESGYGFLLAMQGTGTVAMALLLAVHADRFPRSKVAVGGLAVAVGALVVTAGTVHYPIALVAFLCLGFAHVMIVVSLNTAMQYQLDDAYRGRVFSIYLMGVQLGPAIGTTALGAVAQGTSTRIAAGLAAALLAVYLMVAVVRFDRLRGLDLTDDRPDVPVATSTNHLAGVTARSRHALSDRSGRGG